MTSYVICNVTKALLKYGKYIEKLKLTAQAVHMQITMVCISFLCVNRMIGGLYYIIKRISKVYLSCFGALCIHPKPPAVCYLFGTIYSLQDLYNSWYIFSDTLSNALMYYGQRLN